MEVVVRLAIFLVLYLTQGPRFEKSMLGWSFSISRSLIFFYFFYFFLEKTL